MSATPRNMELDRLRAIAALLTLYMHFMQVFHPWTFTLDYKGPSSPGDIFSNAWAGVDLFFVISGYIISKTVIGQFDAARRDPRLLALQVKAFYVRRMFRIFPIAWVILLGVMLCSVFFNEAGRFASLTDYTQGAVSIFTYVFNYWFPDHKSAALIPIAPYWSLAVEEQFYLVYPLFLLLVTRNRSRAWALAGALVAIGLVIRPFLMSDPLHTFFYTHSRCDGLIWGCLVYLMTQQPWFAAVKVAAGKQRYGGGVVAIILGLAIGAVTAIGFSTVFIIPIVCVLSALLVAMAACEGDVIVFPQPLQAFIDYIGKRSYTIYLVHIPLFYVACEIMYRYTQARGIQITPALWSAYTVLWLLLMGAVTEGLYRFVEQPMIRRGRRVAERIIAAGDRAPDAKGAQIIKPQRGIGGALPAAVHHPLGPES
jgi:peptidoglycan/LPS O-acetylase OafA/YrhL